MLSQEAIQRLLGIEEKVHLSPREMADQLNITFYPKKGYEVSSDTVAFFEKLRETFSRLRVNIVPYEQALERLPITKVLKRLAFAIWEDIKHVWLKGVLGKEHEVFFTFSGLIGLLRRTRIKKGVSVVVLGEQKVGEMPMEFIYTFKDSSVISVVDFPKDIDEETGFTKHFDTAMALFSYHMTNIVIGVSAEKWILYNFNASHPIYPNTNDISGPVLKALIPKIVAPIMPNKFSEFIVEKTSFNPRDAINGPVVQDLVEGALRFEDTKLYPAGKRIDELPFRNSFHRWIGKLHLDNRNGMSFGFLARQMPTIIPDLTPLLQANPELVNLIPKEKDFFVHKDEIYLLLRIEGGEYILKSPDIWVLTQRSGSNKTHVNPDTDLLKLGLSHGKMRIQAPSGLVLHEDYKPSFDTRVILAHALGNVIVAAILKHFSKGSTFSNQLEKNGLSISHWHGYMDPQKIPFGWHAYGSTNPHVACSSPQSAIYALAGKLETLGDVLKSDLPYNGDVHIEPHHGSNITYTNLNDLVTLLLTDPKMTELGNKYLYRYTM